MLRESENAGIALKHADGGYRPDMNASRLPRLDSTAVLMAEGYAWLPGLFRRTDGHLVRARLMGRPAVALRGPDAVRFFYDEAHIRRGGALPEPVRGTLFGKGAVHGLDGETHRLRKAMFVSLLTAPDAVAALVEQVAEAWDDAVTGRQGRMVLFDEVSKVLTLAVCRWSGIPVDESEASAVARDLVSMIDGFATLGPRHWRARRARGRRERWLADVVKRVRSGSCVPPVGSVLDVVSAHRGADGRLLEPRIAAVELLNIIRPTVAISWFAVYAAHALYRWQECRDRLRTGDPSYGAAFVHEIRRFYPFAPFVGGMTVTDLDWQGEPIAADCMVFLDLYGQNHDKGLWGDPYAFRPERFLERPVERDELVPQGGGDPSTGHRCPGEAVTIRVLEALCRRLASLEYAVPPQNLSISLRRIPARIASGFVIILGK
ncbi:cytochrome P450 [Kribbella sp. NPDC026611]|uniref:cytochrome P450 n=1 Tax=Kribbella sp. NPDC026611 TaxID=3154911 RepID=UPI0033D60BD5